LGVAIAGQKQQGRHSCAHEQEEAPEEEEEEEEEDLFWAKWDLNMGPPSCLQGSQAEKKLSCVVLGF
jgi:hypothetical protein